MTRPGAGAFPRAAGGCCQGAAGGASPEAATRESPSPLGDFRPIADRPAAAAGRSEAGHWEGDLIIGKNNRSAAVTLTERVSRQTLVAALPHGYDARHTADAVTAALAASPATSCAPSPGTKDARWPAGPTSKPPSTSRSTSVTRAHRGSGPPTSKPTAC